MILVYVASFANPQKGLTGLTAEKWPELLRYVNGQPRPHLKKDELGPDDERLSINELVEWFPPPAVVEST